MHGQNHKVHFNYSANGKEGIKWRHIFLRQPRMNEPIQGPVE